MATERKAPDVLIVQTNLNGVVADIQDDPDSPDGAWLTAISNNANSICRVSFPTPTGAPNIGADLQEFRALVRKFGGTGTPTARVELYENGILIRAGSDIDITTDTVLAFTWNANELGTPDGSLVECRIYGTKAGGAPAKRATIEVGAVEWNVDYTSGGEFIYAGNVPLTPTPDMPKGILGMIYGGDVAVNLLPSYISSLDRVYLGNVGLMALPGYISALDRVYGGETPLMMLPDFEKAVLEKAYGGDVGLVLLPNSIYELTEGEANEFLYNGDVGLVMLPTYSPLVEAVYAGAMSLSILPSCDSMMEKFYNGEIGLALLPASVYELIAQLTEFVYNGEIPLSILPEHSLMLSRLYSGEIAFSLVPTSRALRTWDPMVFPPRETDEEEKPRLIGQAPAGRVDDKPPQLITTRRRR